MTEKEVVLFVPSGANAFDQQLATARYLASEGGIEPHFLLITIADHQLIQRLEEAGISFSTLDPIREDRQEPKPAIEETSPWGSASKGRGPLKAYYWWKYLSNRKKLTKAVVRSLKPRCNIVSQERPRFFLPVLKALQESSIPTILIPVGFDSSPEGNAWARRDSDLLKVGLEGHESSPGKSRVSTLTAILNRQVGRWLPSQVYDSRWGKTLFYPALQTLLLKVMGMLPRNPWYQGTTFADFIMISGVDEAALYAEAQVDPARILFYGSHEFDTLYERWSHRKETRRNLVEDYQLDVDRRTLIVTLPRLWEQNLATEEEHWRSITQILDVLSRQDLNVVISLHPHSGLAQYAWIEEKYPFKICTERLSDILVAADIFVASYSSTIRWAVGLGIPVINIDFWKFDWDMYAHLSYCKTVNSISEFDEAIKELANLPNDNDQNGGPDSKNDTNALLVDGRAKERLLDFIQSPALGAQPSIFDNKVPTGTGVNGV